jgi:hypothetical protein
MLGIGISKFSNFEISQSRSKDDEEHVSASDDDIDNEDC